MQLLAYRPSAKPKSPNTCLWRSFLMPVLVGPKHPVDAELDVLLVPGTHISEPNFQRVASSQEQSGEAAWNAGNG